MKYSKTDVGQQAFKERSPLLSARQRSAFIMFDGDKRVDKVLAATAGIGVTQADIDHMLTQGFLAPVQVAAAAGAAAGKGPGSAADRTPAQRYADAYPIATQLTASLGLRGFKLNLAVEAASGYDDLLALLPRLQEAIGPQACRELEQALKG